MSPVTRTLCLLIATAALAACNRQGPQVPKPVDDNTAVQHHNDGVESVTVNPNAAKAGAEVDGNGDIATPVHEFTSGQTVYISVPTKFGRKNGEKLEVFWFSQGKSQKEDAKAIQGPFTVFEYAPTEPGAYNVEVDANGRPVALVQFEVK
jgi:predicted small lipoprotein YifL